MDSLTFLREGNRFLTIKSRPAAIKRMGIMSGKEKEET